ncbi:MAG: DUF6427 family protein [Flavobacteriaceae bacterium]|nr:DUF6427 family protein [Flavobacteriaceae bacterium]
MALFFVVHHFLSSKTVFNLGKVAFQTLMLVVFLLSMLLVDFISRKNNLTNNNTFKILLFAIFVTTFPATFLYTEVLTANFFILLALRRIISLKTKKDIQKKIFDAALWIALASCIYFWSILFMGVLFISIVQYAGTNFKNYLIPFLGMAAIIILTNTYTLFVQNAFYLPLDWVRTSGFDFQAYYHIQLLYPLSFFLGILLWSIVDFYLGRKHKSKTKKRTTMLISFILAIAICSIILTPQKNGGELLFMAMPFSVLSANYFEKKGDFIFKEVVLWLLLLMPFFVLFL